MRKLHEWTEKWGQALGVYQKVGGKLVGWTGKWEVSGSESGEGKHCKFSKLKSDSKNIK